MEPFIAQIIMFGGNFAPRGWAFCEGQTLAIAENQALFSLLGTTYGGDGRTNFKLPDLRGRVPINPGTGPGLSTHRQGQNGGMERETISQQQLPNHTHTATLANVSGTVSLNANSANGAENSASGNYPAGVANGRDTLPSYSTTKDATLAADAGEVNLTGGTVTVGATGGSQPINVMQPYLATYYIIALQGTYPSRN